MTSTRAGDSVESAHANQAHIDIIDAVDVSVIVPVFNCEAWLEALLASVLDQAGVSLEVIAICDGATDGSLAIL